MREIVLSMLRLRVLGLVIVVPKLAARPWPRRKALGDGIIPLPGDTGDIGVDVESAAGTAEG